MSRLGDKYKQWKQTRSVKRLVEQKIAEPYPTASEIYSEMDSLPKQTKKAHALEIRRGYRSRHSELSSNQRQVLAEQVAGPLYAKAEANARDSFDVA